MENSTENIQEEESVYLEGCPNCKLSMLVESENGLVIECPICEYWRYSSS